MKVLKTIVATAVVVFAMTTVAMAGVQHLTKAQDEQAVDKTPARYAVTLTARQMAHLGDQSGSHVGEAQRTRTHARHVRREHTQAQHRAQQGAREAEAHEAEAQHVDRIRSSVQSGSGGQSGSHHSETRHQTYTSGSGHDSGHGGGHGGD